MADVEMSVNSSEPGTSQQGDAGHDVADDHPFKPSMVQRTVVRNSAVSRPTEDPRETFSSKDPAIVQRLHQTMHRETCRLKSYEGYPGPASSKLLAANGFFYTQTNDTVQCYFCEVVVGYWLKNDDITEHHFTYSPACPLLNRKDNGQNVPISPVITSAIQDTVSNYIDEHRKKNKPITSSLDPTVEYRLHAYLEDSLNITLPPKVNPIIRDPTHGPLVSEQTRRRQQELEDQITCKICVTNPSTRAFLPCGHMCCCCSCAESYLEVHYRCPVCRTPIAQNVKIFF